MRRFFGLKRSSVSLIGGLKNLQLTRRPWYCYESGGIAEH